MEVTDDSSVNEAVRSIVQKAGPIQHLVNNAGYAATGALEETSVEEARQLFETNFFGVLRVTNAVLPGMRQTGHGRIVNISSVLGFLPAPYMGIYCASKHALEGYTETLDHEVREFGVRAMLIEHITPKAKSTRTGRPPRRLSKNMTCHESGSKRPFKKASSMEMSRSWWPKRCAAP